MTTMTLEEAYDWLLPFEGGDHFDPDDRGLRTKFGISKRAHPTVNFDTLTLADAREIYRVDYWDRMRCPDLGAAALVVFDSAVNQGPHYAGKMLQRCLGGLKVDGKIGPKTLARLKLRDPKKLVIACCVRRMLRYIATQMWRKYQRGWTRRLMSCCFTSGENY